MMGEPNHLPEVLPLAGYPRFNLKRVVIAGGSREASSWRGCWRSTDRLHHPGA
jgi:hypothetical protein